MTTTANRPATNRANKKRTRHVEHLQHLPDHTAVQIDKRDGEWLLTYWIASSLTIRLRIRHASYDVAPDEFICEVSEAMSGYEFRSVGHLLWHPDDDPTIQDWPYQCPTYFKQLANLWHVFGATANWGLALGGIPITSDESMPDVSRADDARFTATTPPATWPLDGASHV